MYDAGIVANRSHLLTIPFGVRAVLGSARLLGGIVSDLAMVVGFGGLAVLQFRGRR
jgi:hypothetical protein